MKVLLNSSPPEISESCPPLSGRPSHTRLLVQRDDEEAPESVRNILSLIEEALKLSTSGDNHVYIIEEVETDRAAEAGNFDFVEIMVTSDMRTVVRGRRSILRAVMAEATFHTEPFRQTG